MDRKKIIAENPVFIGEHKIIVLVEISLNHWHGKDGMYFWGLKKPVAVATVLNNNIKIFSINKKNLSYEYVINKIEPLLKAGNER